MTKKNNPEPARLGQQKARLLIGLRRRFCGKKIDYQPKYSDWLFEPNENSSLQLVDNSDAIDRSRYALIGSVSAEAIVLWCDADIGLKECSSTSVSEDSLEQELLERASEAGGDLLMYTKKGYESSYGSRFGGCLWWDYTTDFSGDRVRECSRYEEIRTRSDYYILTADVYKDDPALAVVAAQRAKLAAEQKRVEEERNQKRRAELRAQAERLQAEQKRIDQKRKAWINALANGSHKEVLAAIKADKTVLNQMIFHDSKGPFHDLEIDGLTFAISRSNYQAVDALLESGLNPNKVSFAKKLFSNYPLPPLWAVLQQINWLDPDDRFQYIKEKAQQKTDLIKIYGRLIEAQADLKARAPKHFFYADVPTIRSLLAAVCILDFTVPGTRKSLFDLTLQAAGHSREELDDARALLTKKLKELEEIVIPNFQNIESPAEWDRRKLKYHTAKAQENREMLSMLQQITLAP